MRILLIGGTGFIGPDVVSALMSRGHDVTVFHRGNAPLPPGARAIIGDRNRLADHAADLRAVRADVVVDLILSSGAQARALVDVFRNAASRLVVLSSCDVYRAIGISHKLEDGPLEPVPLTESSPLRTKLQTYPPANIKAMRQVFGWVDDDYDKIPVERTVMGDASLPATVLRLPMVYGPRDPLYRFLPIVRRVLDGRRTIPFSADMAQWRAPKGFVVNVAEAIAMAAVNERAVGRIFNVGEPDALNELEWAQKIAAAMNWDGEFVVLPNDQVPPYLRAVGNPAQHWVTDTSRIRTELGYRERVTRDEAVRETVEWTRRNPPTGFTPHQFDYAAEDEVLV
jgi:nucleoside-diphosphate-sugar epimerase